MEAESYTGPVAEGEGGIRLDRYASENLKLLSRSQMKNRLVKIRVNGRDVKPSRLVKTGDMLELSWLPQGEETIEAEDIPLDLLYEDNRVVVVNKKQGMVVHPGAGNRRGTLANALLFRRTLLRPGEDGVYGQRTGIVHRLDKDTSGVIIAAYDDEALAFLSNQFKERTIGKRYAALVKGRPAETRGKIGGLIFRDPRDRKKFSSSPLLPGFPEPKGRNSLSFYRVIKSWDAYSLLLVRPRTGRTHQIRVHLKSIGTPILGDPLYGSRDGRFPGATLMLHSLSLSITLPGEDFPRRFTAPLPERMKGIIRCLNGPG
ncbi:MAG: RluA family pseudouridine synthase [Treponema sp.]|jgi:23S rRNA pseudouridine1911/1915/1917 synthase|nr:RluA family pseudouridine synthase [Treponema sp.]